MDKLLRPDKLNKIIKVFYINSVGKRETLKSPKPFLSPSTIRQEIPYENCNSPSYDLNAPLPSPIPYTSKGNFNHYQLWPSNDDKHSNDVQCEIYQGLTALVDPFVIDTVADKNSLGFYLHCLEEDKKQIEDAYLSRLPNLVMTDTEDKLALHINSNNDKIDSSELVFLVMMPFPSLDCCYSDKITTFENLNVTDLFIQICRNIEENEIVISRNYICPTNWQHDWSSNLQTLRQHEYNDKIGDTISVSNLYGNQTPSNYLPFESAETQKKGSKDYQYFSVNSMIVAVVKRENAESYMKSFVNYFSQIKIGGKPLVFLTQKDFIDTFGSVKNAMYVICSCQTYFNGCLVNQLELSTLCNLGAMELDIVKNELIEVDCQKSPKIPDEFKEGDIPLGFAKEFNKIIELNIWSKYLTNLSNLYFGESGSGKSNFIVWKILKLLENGGNSVFLFDHHSSTARHILKILAKENKYNVFVFTLGENMVPCWTFTKTGTNEELFLIASNMTDAIMASAPSPQSRYRMWNNIFNLILAILVYPWLTFATAPALLFAKKGKYKKVADRIRHIVIEKLEERGFTEASRFFSDTLIGYSQSELDSFLNKLNRLISHPLLNLMFNLKSEQNLIDLEEFTSKPTIFISMVTTAQVGMESCIAVNSLILAELQNIMFRRMNKRIDNNVHIFLEESDLYDNKFLSTLMTEGRKAGYIGHLIFPKLPSSYDRTMSSVLNNIGVKNIFRSDPKTVEQIVRGYSKKSGSIKPDDVADLEQGEFILNVNNKLIKCFVPKVEEPEEDLSRDVIEANLKKYYRSAEELGPVDLNKQLFEDVETKKKQSVRKRRPLRF